MSEVVLTYKRTGDTYEASISLDEALSWAATAISFSDMIVNLSAILQALPDCRLIFRRNDRPGLRDFLLSNADRDLIIINPLLYVTASQGDFHVVVRKPTPKESRVKVHIRAGYDTLADAFGDNVYVRHRDDGKVECPCCGRWTAELDDTDVLRCRCVGRVAIAKLCGSWVEIPTTELLELRTVTRFYLPRVWNVPGPWISREALVTQLDAYFKEAQDVRE